MNSLLAILWILAIVSVLALARSALRRRSDRRLILDRLDRFVGGAR